MADVYSPALAASLAFLVGAVLCLISGSVSGSAHLLRLVRVGIGLATLFLAAAVWSHIAIGHSPGSPRALGPIGFVIEHPAILGVLAGAGALILWLRRGRFR